MKYPEGSGLPAQQIVVRIGDVQFFGVAGSRGAQLSPLSAAATGPGAISGSTAYASAVRAFASIAEPNLEDVELIERAPEVAPLRDRSGGKLQLGASFDLQKTSAWVSANGDIEIRHAPPR